MTLPEDTECPIGSLIQLPEIVRFGDTTWAFSEAPVLPKPKQGPVPVIDADGRQMLTDLDDGVLYYPQRVEKNNVKLHTEDAVDSQHVCPDVVVDVDPMPQDCGDHKPDASLQDFKPFTGNYKNHVDFEEELLRLGDHEHLTNSLRRMVHRENLMRNAFKTTSNRRYSLVLGRLSITLCVGSLLRML